MYIIFVCLSRFVCEGKGVDSFFFDSYFFSYEFTCVGIFILVLYWLTGFIRYLGRF